MQKVIITGADGFVGSYTVDYFLKQGKEVLALDIGETPRRLKAHPNLKYLKMDVTDVELFKKTVEKDYYDTFIHFAWAGSAGPERIDYNLQMNHYMPLQSHLQPHYHSCQV